MSPLISIIVPVYKVEDYLNRCVESIVSQTYNNLEIILVDDGSPDKCPEMCDEWALKDSRIKVIHKENGGLSDARNEGLKVATGEYISFVDSDDWIDLQFVSLLYETLVINNADVVECATAYVNETGERLKIRLSSKCNTLNRIEALSRLVQEDGVYQTVWNKLYKKNALDGIWFKKGKYNEDDFWTYQIFDRIDKLALVEGPLYNYLQRKGSIMGSAYSLKRLDGLEARFERMKYLQKHEQIAVLVRKQFIFDCMYHYQRILRNLQGEEKEKALVYIEKMISDTPKISGKLVDRRVELLWITLFKLAPRKTAAMRNRLGIGV